jgi:heme A synthase
LRAANIVSLLYALSMLAFALPMFFVLSLFPAPAGQEQQLGAFRWLVFIYPVLGLIFGWLGALVGAFLYNVIAGRIGGFHFDYEPELAASAPPRV